MTLEIFNIPRYWALTIIFGGIFGLFFGKRLKASMQETLTKTAGLAVLMLGLGGTMEKML